MKSNLPEHISDDPLKGSRTVERGSELEALSDEDLIMHTAKFLEQEVSTLSQAEVTQKVIALLPQLARRKISGSEFCFSLPGTVSSEEIRKGDSAYVKVYRALFELSKTDEYKNSIEVKEILREFQNSIDQNPQMMGPVAMWSIAKEVLWQRDIDPWVKQSLYGSMTYALAFFNQAEYSAQLLKQLDLEDTDNYSEVSHMLEAIKGFWSAGQESYAQDRGVSNFFVDVLEKLEVTADTNFLLSLRARQLKSMLEQSEDFPAEVREKLPFELSKGLLASTNRDEGLALVPSDQNSEVEKAVSEYQEIEKVMMPPQWMIDEAVERGDRWVTWKPPADLSRKHSELFGEIHSRATIPLASFLASEQVAGEPIDEQLIYDYEYLVSKPMRTIIQQEFLFELKSLSIKEQLYFLNYLKRITSGEADEIKNFTVTYGVTGMRTFLALERGTDDLGDQIVAFGQHETVAKRVFAYYCELLDIAEDAERLVRDNTDCEGDLCIQYTNQVRENILNRAQKDLERAVRTDDVSQIEVLLGTYVAEAKEHVAILQELGIKEAEVVPAGELGEEDKGQMLALLEQNYGSAYSAEGDAAFRAQIKASLEQSFTNPDTEFHILRHKAKIISFNRFDNSTNSEGGRVSYFGSFNADPAYSGVGGVMLERTIQEQLEKSDVMYAHCDPTSEIAKKYIESGFVAKETETVAGKFSFEIWRTKDIVEHLPSKQMTTKELVEETFQENDIIVRETSENDSFEELDQDLGYLLTRYFKYGDKTYVVFETPSPTLWNQFQA